MTARVDLVNVAIDAFDEFEGRRSITFSFVPGPEDAALVAALSAKNDALLLAAAKDAGQAPLGIG